MAEHGGHGVLVSRDAALDDVVMTDVSAFTLGIEISREVRGQPEPGYFLPIIERNTVVPVSREEVVSPAHPEQRQVTLNIFQGEAPMVENNIRLGSMTVDLPKGTDPDGAIAVRFTYDVSGLLEVDATVRATGDTHRAVLRELAGDVPDAEIEAIFQKLAALKVHPRDMDENIALHNRISECYAMTRFDDRERLISILQQFDEVLARQDAAEIAEFRARTEPVIKAFEGSYVR